MTIIKNGKLNIPLYHGTTSAFVNSIKEHGLGSVDPLDKTDAKLLMKDLFELAEKECWRDDNWLEFRKFLNPLVTQDRN